MFSTAGAMLPSWFASMPVIRSGKDERARRAKSNDTKTVVNRNKDANKAGTIVIIDDGDDDDDDVEIVHGARKSEGDSAGTVIDEGLPGCPAC